MEEILRLGWTQLNSLFYVTLTEPGDYDEGAKLIFGSDIFHNIGPAKYAITIKSDSFTAKKTIDFASLSKKKLKALIYAMCATHHEMAHIMMASSDTAVLWLILEQRRMLKDVHSAISRIREEGCRILRIPIWKWAEDPLLSTPWSRELTKLANYIYRWELSIGRITGFRNMTIAQAIEEQREIKAIEPAAPDFYTEIDSSLPSSPNGLTMHHLTEAQARFADYGVLAMWQSAGAPGSVIYEIMQEMRVKGYYEAFDYLRAALPSTNEDALGQLLETFEIAIHLALSPQVISFTEMPEATKWEDHQPCWRFVKVIDALGKIGNVPDSPLKEYHNFVDELCSVLGWISPLEHAADLASIDNFDDYDPINKDFLERHKIYYNYLISDGLPPSGFFISPFAERFVPWMKSDGLSMYFQNVSPGVSDELAQFFCEAHLILEDIVGNSTLETSKRIHSMFWHDRIESGDYTFEDSDREFSKIVSALLGFSPNEIRSF